MKKQQPIHERAMPRREALKGLGALAIATPGLAAISCSGGERETIQEQPASAAGSAAESGSTAPAGAAGVVAQPAKPRQTSAEAGASAPVRAADAPAGGPAGSRAAAGASGSVSSATSAGAGAAGAAGGGAAGAVASAGAAAPATGDFIPVMFDDAASCMLTPTDPAGEGPFFVHEDEVMNDASLLRVDMRDGRPGVELQLNLRLLDSDGKCMTPIAGVQVYTWHTDAVGLYSGFADQNPDQPYMGAGERTIENMDRFCRGMQISGEDGTVRFKTVYPGWYNGRAIHIHFLALRPGSDASTMSYRSKQFMVFTTQMYFAEAFSRMIHENHDPYKKRASGSAYERYVKPQNMTVNPSARMQGEVAVAALNIITSAAGSRR